MQCLDHLGLAERTRKRREPISASLVIPSSPIERGIGSMSATGLEVFDRTLQITNTWLDEMMATLPRDRKLAWHVLGTVLRTIRDRVPANLAAHLGAQLPLLVRGIYYDQWRPSEPPKTWRSADEFLSIVAAELSSVKPVGADDAVRAVFRVLNHHVDPHQVEKVRHALPEEVQKLWPADSQVSSAA
jgi:uncharacterized protein (DUF2267 family)